MDRLGTGRVCTVLGIAAAVLTLAYPLWPSIGGLLALQTLVGFLHVTCWIGAQAMIGTLAGGNPGAMGRFTFVTTLGTFLGPLLVGPVWEFLGPWGAFTLVSAWSLAFALIAAATPRARGAASQARVRAADLIPKWADYAAGFRLLRSPIVACFMVVSAALAATYAMRHTFLSAYLDASAFQGTEIGIIFGAMALAGAAAGLSVGYLSRHVRPHWLTIAATVLGALSFSTLPLFTGFWPLLAVSLATGICTGTAFPLVLAILTREISTGDQGLSGRPPVDGPTGRHRWRCRCLWERSSPPPTWRMASSSWAPSSSASPWRRCRFSCAPSPARTVPETGPAAPRGAARH